MTKNYITRIHSLEEAAKMTEGTKIYFVRGIQAIYGSIKKYLLCKKEEAH